MNIHSTSQDFAYDELLYNWENVLVFTSNKMLLTKAVRVYTLADAWKIFGKSFFVNFFNNSKYYESIGKARIVTDLDFPKTMKLVLIQRDNILDKNIEFLSIYDNMVFGPANLECNYADCYLIRSSPIFGGYHNTNEHTYKILSNTKELFEAELVSLHNSLVVQYNFIDNKNKCVLYFKNKPVFEVMVENTKIRGFDLDDYKKRSNLELNILSLMYKGQLIK